MSSSIPSWQTLTAHAQHFRKGQGSGFLSEGSSWLTACMSEQWRFWRDCADAYARLNLRCSHGRYYQIRLTRPISYICLCWDDEMVNSLKQGHAHAVEICIYVNICLCILFSFTHMWPEFCNKVLFCSVSIVGKLRFPTFAIQNRVSKSILLLIIVRKPAKWFWNI